MSRKTAKTTDGKPSKGHIKAAIRKAERTQKPLHKTISEVFLMEELKPFWLCLVALLVFIVFVAVSSLSVSTTLQIALLIIFAVLGLLVFRICFRAFAAMNEKEKQIEEEIMKHESESSYAEENHENQ